VVGSSFYKFSGTCFARIEDYHGHSGVLKKVGDVSVGKFCAKRDVSIALVKCVVVVAFVFGGNELEDVGAKLANTEN